MASPQAEAYSSESLMHGSPPDISPWAIISCGLKRTNVSESNLKSPPQSRVGWTFPSHLGVTACTQWAPH